MSQVLTRQRSSVKQAARHSSSLIRLGNPPTGMVSPPTWLRLGKASIVHGPGAAVEKCYAAHNIETQAKDKYASSAQRPGTADDDDMYMIL